MRPPSTRRATEAPPPMAVTSNVPELLNVWTVSAPSVVIVPPVAVRSAVV
jgi:hypothetical protein